VRAIGPAGWSSHGFFGFRAKTFGNPSGATSGNGGVTPPSQGPQFVNRGNIGGGHAIYAMAADGAGNALAVSNIGQVFKSVNGGVTWAMVDTIANFAANIGQVSGDMLTAAGTWVLGAGGESVSAPMVYRSANVGAAWTGIAATIDNAGGYVIGTNGTGTWLLVGNIENPGSPDIYGSSTNDSVSYTSAGVTTIGGTAPPTIILEDGGTWILPSVDPVSENGAIWTTTDLEDWTEILLANTGEQFGQIITNGSAFFACSNLDNDVYTGATLADLAAATAISPIATPLAQGLEALYIIGSGFIVLDFAQGAAVSADFLDWGVAGSTNLAAGESYNCSCYDSVHDTVIVGGTAGSISTYVG